jgi:hypothetical protein
MEELLAKRGKGKEIVSVVTSNLQNRVIGTVSGLPFR